MSDDLSLPDKAKMLRTNLEYVHGDKKKAMKLYEEIGVFEEDYTSITQEKVTFSSAINEAKQNGGQDYLMGDIATIIGMKQTANNLYDTAGKKHMDHQQTMNTPYNASVTKSFLADQEVIINPDLIREHLEHSGINKSNIQINATKDMSGITLHDVTVSFNQNPDLDMTQAVHACINIGLYQQDIDKVAFVNTQDGMVNGWQTNINTGLAVNNFVEPRVEASALTMPPSETSSVFLEGADKLYQLGDRMAEQNIARSNGNTSPVQETLHSGLLNLADKAGEVGHKLDAMANADSAAQGNTVPASDMATLNARIANHPDNPLNNVSDINNQQTIEQTALSHGKY